MDRSNMCVNSSPPKQRYVSMEKLCRVCLKKGNKPLFIAGDETLSNDLRKLLQFSNVNIDGYPNSLCSKCYCTIKQFVKLRVTARIVELKLFKYYKHIFMKDINDGMQSDYEHINHVEITNNLKPAKLLDIRPHIDMEMHQDNDNSTSMQITAPTEKFNNQQFNSNLQCSSNISPTCTDHETPVAPVKIENGLIETTKRYDKFQDELSSDSTMTAGSDTEKEFDSDMQFISNTNLISTDNEKPLNMEMQQDNDNSTSIQKTAQCRPTENFNNEQFNSDLQHSSNNNPTYPDLESPLDPVKTENDLIETTQSYDNLQDELSSDSTMTAGSDTEKEFYSNMQFISNNNLNSTDDEKPLDNLKIENDLIETKITFDELHNVVIHLVTLDSTSLTESDTKEEIDLDTQFVSNNSSNHTDNKTPLNPKLDSTISTESATKKEFDSIVQSVSSYNLNHTTSKIPDTILMVENGSAESNKVSILKQYHQLQTIATEHCYVTDVMNIGFLPESDAAQNFKQHTNNETHAPLNIGNGLTEATLAYDKLHDVDTSECIITTESVSLEEFNEQIISSHTDGDTTENRPMIENGPAKMSILKQNYQPQIMATENCDDTDIKNISLYLPKSTLTNNKLQEVFTSDSIINTESDTIIELNSNVQLISTNNLNNIDNETPDPTTIQSSFAECDTVRILKQTLQTIASEHCYNTDIMNIGLEPKSNLTYNKRMDVVTSDSKINTEDSMKEFDSDVKLISSKTLSHTHNEISHNTPMNENGLAESDTVPSLKHHRFMMQKNAKNLIYSIDVIDTSTITTKKDTKKLISCIASKNVETSTNVIPSSGSSSCNEQATLIDVLTKMMKSELDINKDINKISKFPIIDYYSDEVSDFLSPKHVHTPMHLVMKYPLPFTNEATIFTEIVSFTEHFGKEYFEIPMKNSQVDIENMKISLKHLVKQDKHPPENYKQPQDFLEPIQKIFMEEEENKVFRRLVNEGYAMSTITFGDTMDMFALGTYLRVNVKTVPKYILVMPSKLVDHDYIVGNTEIESLCTKYYVKQLTSITCEDCNQTFCDWAAFSLHSVVWSHYGKCTVCKELSTSSAKKCAQHLQQFTTKMRFAHRRRTECVVCTICGETRRLEMMKRHMMIHNKGNLHLSCPLCPFRTRHPTSLKLHERRHSDQKPVKCPLCSKDFRNRSNLTSHMYRRHASKDYECFCGKRFNRKLLKEHMRKVHLPKRVSVRRCRLCPMVFDKASDLNKHRLEVHPNEPYPRGAVPLHLRPGYETKSLLK